MYLIPHFRSLCAINPDHFGSAWRHIAADMLPRVPPLLHCLTDRIHAYLIGSPVIQGNCRNPTPLNTDVSPHSIRWICAAIQLTHIWSRCSRSASPCSSCSHQSPWTSPLFILSISGVPSVQPGGLLTNKRETRTSRCAQEGRTCLSVSSGCVSAPQTSTKGLNPEDCTAALTFTKSCCTWQREACPRSSNGIFPVVWGLAY